MKKTELTKSLGLKIKGRMQQAPIPDRFGAAANAVPDRREQRKLDHAAGLVPFAVKLHQDLVVRLNEVAAQEGVSPSELTARLLAAGLGQSPARPPAKQAAETASATQVSAKKTTVKTVAGKTKTPEKKATATTGKAPGKKAAESKKTAPAEKAAAESGKAAKAPKAKAA